MEGCRSKGIYQQYISVFSKWQTRRQNYKTLVTVHFFPGHILSPSQLDPSSH